MGGSSVFHVFLFLCVSEGHFVRVDDSPVTCSTEGVKCDDIGDNMIDEVTPVLTLEECRQLCLDQTTELVTTPPTPPTV